MASLVQPIHPFLYFGLLTFAVGLGFPGGALVVGSGVLDDGAIGVPTVLLGQAAGLLLNWRLCRGMLRPRMQR